MGIYVWKPTPYLLHTETFWYTWSDQHYTVPQTWEYVIETKGAWSLASCWGLAKGTFCLNCWDELSIMVWQSWGGTSWTTYWFWWSSTYAGSGNLAWGGLSGVFIGSGAILSTDTERALIIAWGAGWWRCVGSCWSGWGATWANWCACWYGTAGWWGTQTGRWSGGNAGANQFDWWNGWGTYGYGWGWWWWWWNGSIWDSSWNDDKGAWGWSGYVKSTATDVTLTQWWGCGRCCNGWVTVSLVWYCWSECTIKNIYLWCNI